MLNFLAAVGGVGAILAVCLIVIALLILSNPNTFR